MSAWCVTVTMQGTKGPDAHALVSLSSEIWLWLTGFLRNKQPLRLLSLVLNSLLWSTELKSCKDKNYKLRMMGIPLTGPSFMYADNKSQVTNSTIPESTLKKKCNSICYHAVWESVAMSESLITHIDSEDSLSDLMTKWPAVVNTVNWLVTSFMTSMMTILSNEARPANPDQLILRGLKKSARSYLLYLLTSYILAGMGEYTEDTFVSMSSEFCTPDGSYFGYSVFPGVMLASLMHTPESLFPDLQQLLLALVL